MKVEKTRGFLWFWLRPEGGILKNGINLTAIQNGFSLALWTPKVRSVFRFRRGMGFRQMFQLEHMKEFFWEKR